MTGGTGFLGRYVVRRLLARGDEIVVMARESRDTSEIESQGAHVVRGDLQQIEAVESALTSCDVVYHIGARVEIGGDWDAFHAENVEATEKLMAMSWKAGVKRFVYVSSLGIFDIPRSGTVIREDSDYDHHPQLRGHYTRSKIHADRIACAAQRRGEPVVIVRPGRIYGHDHPSLPLFMGRVKKQLRPGLWVIVGRSSYLVPVSYVDNAAEAVVLAGTKEGVEGRIFNVIDDSDLTQRRYFDTLDSAERKRGGRMRVLFVPVGLFVPAVMVVDFLFRLLKRRPWSVAYQLRRSGRNARYSTEAAREELGWEPQLGLQEAVERTLQIGK